MHPPTAAFFGTYLMPKGGTDNTVPEGCLMYYQPSLCNIPEE